MFEVKIMNNYKWIVNNKNYMNYIMMDRYLKINMNERLKN